MLDHTEKMRKIEFIMKYEFEGLLVRNLITEAEYEKYLAELKELTNFIYEQQKGQLIFTKEGWHKINDYYNYVCSLDFVRDYTKEDLEYIWLVVR